MSVILVYYRNCNFCCNLLARLVCSLIVKSGQERHDQIKINFSFHYLRFRHLKNIKQNHRNDDTVYSLNGSPCNSVSVNPVSIDLNYLSQLSFLNHSGV